jgi:cytoskeletal protein CcmA (bactofilin family)
MADIRDSALNAFLGKGSHFEGKLTFDGKVQIDGKFQGEIFSADTLVIGEGASVKAEVEVGTAVVQGLLEGNVHAAESIELKAPGQLRGNIEAPVIVMERGVLFEGNCKMGPKSKGPESPYRPAAPVVTVPAVPAPKKDDLDL